MLGLRYFACEACGTVYASPDEPSDCDRCDGARFAELTDALRADAGAYFSPVD